MAERVTDQVSTKTSEEALEFVQNLQKAFPKTPRSKKEQAALQKYLAQFTDAELRAVGRRVLSDLMQRPPRTIKAGDLPPEPPARPKAHGVIPPTSVGKKAKKGTKARTGPARKRTAGKTRKARRRIRRS
jgi:hypothetical protein